MRSRGFFYRCRKKLLFKELQIKKRCNSNRIVAVKWVILQHLKDQTGWLKYPPASISSYLNAATGVASSGIAINYSDKGTVVFWVNTTNSSIYCIALIRRILVRTHLSFAFYACNNTVLGQCKEDRKTVTSIHQQQNCNLDALCPVF